MAIILHNVTLTMWQGLLSDGRTLFLRNVNFHNSGSYSCEVVADSTFLTLIKSAHMQVVGGLSAPRQDSISLRLFRFTGWEAEDHGDKGEVPDRRDSGGALHLLAVPPTGKPLLVHQWGEGQHLTDCHGFIVYVPRLGTIISDLRRYERSTTTRSPLWWASGSRSPGTTSRPAWSSWSAAPACWPSTGRAARSVPGWADLITTSCCRWSYTRPVRGWAEWWALGRRPRRVTTRSPPWRRRPTQRTSWPGSWLASPGL